ncbi:ScbA/BarX family gamma-butyrolactone biosynthesis protein [Nocardia sp. XZ_19_369]|uniref:ScbA/BarX family gamma-butyrolactone biosynthesis protein n=1 Tax=Nocardia sp. XZ_19_369 TaxID=2769487 RepID=UPI00188E0E5F|nr:ScbA/BarX family gamma-butyrolactone biosynthesis protein [Nocardia sp. XZ_19_369]
MDETAVTTRPAPDDTRAALAALSFEQTVPRALVHRAAVNEVFLTDGVAIGKREWAVAAMLPRSHMLFNDGGNPDYLDTIAIMEVTRQVTEYVAHRFVHVPDNQFLVFRDMRIDIFAPERLRAGPAPARVLTIVNARTSERLAQHPVSIIVDGHECGRAGGRWLPLPLHYYEYIRERARQKTLARSPEPARPVDPSAMLAPDRVGRGQPRNVLLANGIVSESDTMTFLLVVDQTHPVFFDHPMDHVPGMLMLEAARQASLATLSEHRSADPRRCLIVGCEVDFGNFCEPDLATGCRAAIVGSGDPGPSRRHRVRVTFEQAGESLGDIILEVLDLSGSG